MRRVSRIAAAGVATAALAVSVSACGSSSTSSSSSESSDKNLGLALAYDVGGKGDQSFNDAATAGLDQADKEFGYKSTAVEPQDGESDADKVQRLENLAKQGYNPVIGVGFAYAPAVKEPRPSTRRPPSASSTTSRSRPTTSPTSSSTRSRPPTSPVWRPPRPPSPTSWASSVAWTSR